MGHQVSRANIKFFKYLSLSTKGIIRISWTGNRHVSQNWNFLSYKMYVINILMQVIWDDTSLWLSITFAKNLKSPNQIMALEIFIFNTLPEQMYRECI